jgi:hypothetical protein
MWITTRLGPKAHWLRAVTITCLAILHSEMAEAERLRLECSIKQDCYSLDRRFKSCTPTNAVVSVLVDIDFEANTWAEFFTHKDGTQTSASGNLISAGQTDITLRKIICRWENGARKNIKDFWGLFICRTFRHPRHSHRGHMVRFM